MRAFTAADGEARPVHDGQLLAAGARQAARGSGGTSAVAAVRVQPTDIQTAILTDHFTPFTLIQLGELRFCGCGEAKDFTAASAIELG